MIKINPYELLLQIINFGILYYLLKKYLAQPLSSFLSKRAETIKHNIEKAETNRRESENALLKQKEELKAAQVEAQAIRNKAEVSAKKEFDNILEKGKASALQLVDQAKKEIEQETLRAKKILIDDVSGLTIKTLKKFMSNEVSEDQHQNIEY